MADGNKDEMTPGSDGVYSRSDETTSFWWNTNRCPLADRWFLDTLLVHREQAIAM